MSIKGKFWVDIPSWHKYQKDSSRKHKNWVAISTDMMSDLAVRDLPPALFKCWVGVLLHAGKVGVPFQFSESLGKDLFGLRHSPDFQHLVDQGLVEINDNYITEHNNTEQHTTKEKTAREKPKPKPSAKPPKPKPKKSSERFEEFWALYPKKAAKPEALETWEKGGKKRKHDFDAIADTLLADIRKRIQFDDQWQRGFIPNPTTYLNQDRWLDDIAAPVGKQSSSDQAVSAVQQFLSGELN